MPGRILVADDIATNRIVMKVRLSEACYEVLQASGGQDALAVARRERPDLILLDMIMADMDGIEVCRRLRADAETADIPIIIFSADRNPGQKMRALQAGADEFLPKPLDETTLLARVRSLLRARETTQELALRDSTRRVLGFAEPPETFARQGRVALVAARREQALAWKTALRSQVHATLEVMTRAQALGDAGAAPDLFVIAADLDRPGDGLRLLTDLRARAATRHSAVLIVVPETAHDTAAMALDLGANDLLATPFDPAELAHRLEVQLRRKHQADRLRASVKDGLRMAVTDPLTGLFNRRYALPHLQQMGDRAAQTDRSFAVMLLDIDHFKAVNDRHGHAAGDTVLERVARQITANLRPSDLVARIGGEEFLVAMPDTAPDLARRMAERLRQTIGTLPILLPEGRGSITVSVSIGMAISPTGLERDVDRLLALADGALYRAKSEGRNKVRSAPNAA
ncbi:diguanylate cyclase [Actibacterium sp. XHP0104]|uniref:diguanylate cyclase n=1 Tax=Actibacterium sp. XHP0104 TaxID=2984335 RepID=UPI0021E7765E|nr:diguanylate cyclase [Actibacterium sp. XHP0104]MCV2881395.1 diguanylate cyclase [Actibacterium sp. XHP0104]